MLLLLIAPDRYRQPAVANEELLAKAGMAYTRPGDTVEYSTVELGKLGQKIDHIHFPSCGYLHIYIYIYGYIYGYL